MKKLPHFLDKGDHSCAFYKNEEERLRVVLPFFRAGLILGEKCVYIASLNDFKIVKKNILNFQDQIPQIDPEDILHIDSEVYLEAFRSNDVVTLCKQWEKMVEGFIAEGYKAVRGIGCLDVEYTEELKAFLLSYEKATASLFDRYPVSAICLYPHRYSNSSFGRKISTTEYHPVFVDPLSV